jgi:hypothetical protein
MGTFGMAGQLDSVPAAEVFIEVLRSFFQFSLKTLNFFGHVNSPLKRSSLRGFDLFFEILERLFET